MKNKHDWEIPGGMGGREKRKRLKAAKKYVCYVQQLTVACRVQGNWENVRAAKTGRVRMKTHHGQTTAKMPAKKVVREVVDSQAF